MYLSRIWFLVCIFVARMAVASLPGLPVPETSSIAPPSEDRKVEELIKTLENDESRQILIRDLKMLLQVQAGQPEKQDHLPINFAFSEVLQTCISTIVSLKARLWSIVKVFRTVSSQRVTLEFLWVGLLSLAAGFGAEWLFLKLYQKLHVSLRQRGKDGVLDRNQIFLIRFLVRIPGFLVFALVPLISAWFFNPEQRAFQMVLAAVGSVIVFKVVYTLISSLFLPDDPELRVVPVGEKAACLVSHVALVIGGVISVSYVLAAIFRVLQAPADVTLFVIKSEILLIGIMAIYYSWQFKPLVNDWITQEKMDGGKSSTGTGRVVMELARSWHPMLVAYVVLMISIMLSSDATRYQARVGLFFNTSVVIIVAYVLFLVMPKLIRKVLQRIEGKHPLIRPRVPVYRRLLSTILVVFIFFTALLYCASLWEIGIARDFFRDRNHGLLLQVASLVFILLFGIISWEVNELLVERKFGKGASRRLSPEGAKRVKTLQPLVRNTGRAFIILFATLMFFSELGLNIAPLLAGASVFGIALSLGGQSLVKDIITGSFILIEDTMNLGDHVEIGGHTGRVEGMSLRTVTLRDNTGGVHSIPFSSIGTIVNMSKNFSICVFDFVIDNSVAMERVREVLQRVEKTMCEDTQWSPHLLEPMEIPGVTGFDDVSYKIRAQVKVAPGKQWAVEREMNWRFSCAFRENGIAQPVRKQWTVVEPAPTTSQAVSL